MDKFLIKRPLPNPQNELAFFDYSDFFDFIIALIYFRGLAVNRENRENNMSAEISCFTVVSIRREGIELWQCRLVCCLHPKDSFTPTESCRIGVFLTHVEKNLWISRTFLKFAKHTSNRAIFHDNEVGMNYRLIFKISLFYTFAKHTGLYIHVQCAWKKHLFFSITDTNIMLTCKPAPTMYMGHWQLYMMGLPVMLRNLVIAG